MNHERHADGSIDSDATQSALGAFGQEEKVIRLHAISHGPEVLVALGAMPP